MIITILLLFILIVLIYNYYIRYGRNGKLIDLIPGPQGYPIFGNIFQCSREESWKVLFSLNEQYYPIFKIWAFYLPVIFIRHPNDLETILNNINHIEKSFFYDILCPWLGNGIFTAGGAKWRSRRKMLTATFHFDILQQFVTIFIKEGEYMTRSLKNTGGTVVKDLMSFVSEHTLNIICETALGNSIRDLDEFQQQYRKAVCQMSEIFIYRLIRQWLHNDWIFSWTPKGKEQAKLLKILHEFPENIIKERKLYHKRTNYRFLENFGSNTSADNAKMIENRKQLALLDLLIAASRKGLLTNTDIKEEIDTFTFGGYDTTAKALTYLLLLLAEHKDIQVRVRNEINTVMEKNGGKVTMKSLQDLSYLDRCIKETLRLYPSGYVISRVTGEEVKLQSYLVPAGTTIFLNIYAVHRDPNFWPNPEIFDPDRFLPERIQNRHPYSYIPFSAGPRNCLGQRYALLEMKAMITPMIHNFYLEPIDSLKNLRIKIDLNPSDLLHIKFVPIK